MKKMLLLGIMLISLQILAVDNDDAIRQQCEQEVGAAAQAGPAQAPYDVGTQAGYPTVGMPTNVQPYQPQPFQPRQQTLQDLIAIFEGINAAPQTVQDLVAILNESPLAQRARQLAALGLVAPARDIDLDQLDNNLKLIADQPQRYFVEGYGNAQQQDLVKLLNGLGLSNGLMTGTIKEDDVRRPITIQEVAQRIREAHQEALQGGALTGQGAAGAIAAANINLDRLPMLAIELIRNPADAIHQAAVNPDMMLDMRNLIRLLHDLQLTRQLLDNRLTAAELEQQVRQAIQDRVGTQAIEAGGIVSVPLQAAAIAAPTRGGAVEDQAGPAGTPAERDAYIRRALDEQARITAEQQALVEAARLRAIEDNARAEEQRLHRAHLDAQAAEQARIADLARLEREAAEQEVLRLQQEQPRAQQNLTAWRAAALQQVRSKAAHKGIKNADAINQMNDLQLAAALGDINRVQQFINQDVNAIEPVTGRSAVGFTGFIDNPGLRDQILDLLLAQGGDLFNAAPGSTTRRQAYLSQSAKAMAQERALVRSGRR